jgi:S-adenosylmethionine/arginine decarboxylase-like enzyme
MWGYHLTVDAGNCDPEALRSKATIAKFIKELVPKIGMVAYGKPQIVKFGTGHTQGYTLVQLIETSDITAHFSEGSNEIYLDVFSCKTFDPKDAIEVFNKYFKATAIRKQFRVRQAPRS